METVEITLNMPKNVAKITICGTIVFMATEDSGFIMPTEIQRMNLKEMLCIDVEPLQEDSSD